MIYITGDTHRDFETITYFTQKFHTTKDDLMIILGDVGINYYLTDDDTKVKRYLENLPITFLCLNGNHEERPENIPTYKKLYKKTNTFEANVYIEEDYPSINFLDNEKFKLFGEKEYDCFSINGAYSVDKELRLLRGYQWFKSEELTTKELDAIWDKRPDKVDFMFSHTCPKKYEPIECYLPMVNQRKVSKRTEIFLDKLEDKMKYTKWYCGHWHIDKKIDKLEFLFKDIKVLGE